MDFESSCKCTNCDNVLTKNGYCFRCRKAGCDDNLTPQCKVEDNFELDNEEGRFIS